MYACIILHNMIVQDEGEFVSEWTDEVEVNLQPPIPGPSEAFAERMERYKYLRSRDTHLRLRNDLVQHLWANIET